MHLQGRFSQTAKSSTNHSLQSYKAHSPRFKIFKEYFSFPLILYWGTMKVVVHLGIQDEYVNIEQNRESSKLLSAPESIEIYPL